MKWFYNMKIRAKLLTGFILIALIVGVVGIIGIVNINALKQADNALYENMTVPLETIRDISTAFQKLQVSGYDIVLSDDPALIKVYADNITAERVEIDTLAAEFEKRITFDQMKTAFSEFADARMTYTEQLNIIVNLAMQNQDAEAVLLMGTDSQFRKAAVAEQAAIDKMTTVKLEDAQVKNDENGAQAASTATTMIIIMIIGVLISIALGLFLSSIIANPLKRAGNMLNEMSIGHLGQRLKMVSKDEIGQMAMAMDGFADDLQNVVIGTMKQISEGDVSADIEVRDEKDEIAPALKQTIETIRGLIAESNILSQAAVEGRLDARGNTGAFKGGFREIMDGVNETINRLVGFIDVMPVPAMIIDNDFSILYMNEMGAKVAGRTPLESIGKKCYNHFKTSDCGTDKCVCARAISSGSTETGETDAHPMNGVDLDITYAGVPIKDQNGEVIGAFEIVNDQTAIKKAARLSIKIADYQKTETEKLVSGLVSLSQGNTDISIEPGVNDADTLDVSKTFRIIDDSLNICAKLINDLVTETKLLCLAAVDGKLDARGNAAAYKGGFREIVEGINNTMDVIIEPIKEASSVLKELADGNLNTLMIGDYKGDHAKIKEDMNRTIKFLKHIMGEITQTLEQVGQGNLDQEITGHYNGDFVNIKLAINDITTSLSEIMAGIDVAANQVDSGAKQISDGGQALAQGTTEQASAIEELTASIEEVADETKRNAVNANEANTLAIDVRTNAELGNSQMEAMVRAMIEINDASKNISKIIKVIDDIAFQTNILALNAAVEAARAGQHGKGFAVVAEEVRSLAARSAEAVKETTGLIEGSINKVEMGTKIADQTAESLKEILVRIEKVAGLVGTIAQASNDQASEIAQITQGIEQVSQVVQTNSATAEESAAASEELSGQAEMLKKMVETFKLKENINMGGGKRSVAQTISERVKVTSGLRILLNDDESDKY
ncbi:MAG: methyl-accepting chemotaxis protein [Acetobacterium sp.]